MKQKCKTYNTRFSIATKSDTPRIVLFIKNVYNQAVAPTYSDEGNNEFYMYISLQAVEKRLGTDHWILKAVDDEVLVGIIEIRKYEHVSMLFVETHHQKQGIGRRLLAEAEAKVKKFNPRQKTLSVHSTPNAVSAYQKLGFQVKSEEQNVGGIRFVAMEKRVL